jgi:hypothetical protein
MGARRILGAGEILGDLSSGLDPVRHGVAHVALGADGDGAEVVGQVADRVQHSDLHSVTSTTSSRLAVA